MSSPSAAEGPRASLTVAELVFRGRALAQTHPLTPLAERVANQAADSERGSQPLPEAAVWARTALVHGYCLRRVEEDEGGLKLASQPTAHLTVGTLDEDACELGADLRAGRPTGWLEDAVRTIAALDRMIVSELDRRREAWRSEVDDEAWAEIEQYVAWWVVYGYAVRVAEQLSGAVA